MTSHRAANESLEDVVDDLRKFLNDGYVTHGFLQFGLRHVEGFLRDVPPVSENPDPEFFFGTGDPNQTFAPHANLRVSEALQQLAVDGPLEQRLGQLWVVYTYTGWEHEYRPRIARAVEVGVTDVRIPLLSDLRLLRNDIVHHHAIATAENAGRCEVVGHWVNVGEPIKIGGREIPEFAQLFPWDEIGDLGS